MTENYEPTQISKYNDAVSSVMRLNESWVLCKQFVRRGKFNRWQTELDNIFLELYPDILKLKNSTGMINRDQILKNNIAKARLSKSKTNLFNALLKRHAFLREVQDDAGKGNVYVDEDEEGFE